VTASVILFVADEAVLTDDIRKSSLLWLARVAEDTRPDDVAAMLARWAHPGLDQAAREKWFGILTDSLERAEALDGPGDWGTEMPELACYDRADEARYQLENRANEALYILTYGEQE
jgi:hypothetical protein